ncbi:hypothetical protein MA16_Dca027511 [Dendrobium catenatum]|uniref:Uncharacterized protein n=1 Tax=Dendrobium catenatum TaxID=906689 RepID=A0A2I0W237_9ASPA|nr:hypothetical protein MA16_Dca027511 [Dendrobium catenatum]
MKLCVRPYLPKQMEAALQPTASSFLSRLPLRCADIYVSPSPCQPLFTAKACYPREKMGEFITYNVSIMHDKRYFSVCNVYVCACDI